MWAKILENNIFIQDIQGGNGKGHGEIAMKHLIAFAKKESKQKINGDLKPTDYPHKDRLIAFYTKMGFKVNYYSEKTGNIEKIVFD